MTRILGLTGTPMPHSPLDIWAQYRILDPTILGYSYVRFRNQWTLPAVETEIPCKCGRTFKPERKFRKASGWIVFCPSCTASQFVHEKARGGVKEDAQAAFTEALARIMFQAERDDLGLPPVRHVRRAFDLGREERRAYAEMYRDFETWISEDECVTAANAMVRLLRLQQITGGRIKTEEGHAAIIGHAKRDALVEVLEDLDPHEPIVVFCRFQADLDAVHDAAKREGRASLELSGRKKELQEWKRGEAPVLAAQIQAGGVGVDLTRAAYTVFYSLGFSLGDYEQALCRSDRPGQTREGTYVHLVARETIDERVYEALAEKKDVVQSILDEVKGKVKA